MVTSRYLSIIEASIMNIGTKEKLGTYKKKKVLFYLFEKMNFGRE